MTDLLHVLPDFELKQFSHILPSLEKALITSNDLLTLDAIDIAKRAQVPPAEVKRLTDEILNQLHVQLGYVKKDAGAESDGAPLTSEDGQGLRKCSVISTLDKGLDATLGGGFATGHLSEVTGESAAGKTQLLLSLLLAVQLPPPYGISKSALYISTEAALQTTRLSQILSENSLLSDFEDSSKPSLSRIHSTKVNDLESQEHVLRYQVPVIIERHNVGLLVIDSVAANFRAEFDKGEKHKASEAFAKRNTQLIQLGLLLQDLARTYDIAIVVANQVLDRFTAAAASVFEYNSRPNSQRPASRQTDLSSRLTPQPEARQRSEKLASIPFTDLTSETDIALDLSCDDPLSLDHQQRFFTGWGDDPKRIHNLKTPSLGLTWTTQLSSRVVLLKEPIFKAQDYVLGPEKEIVGWKRRFKVAFAGWCEDGNGGTGTSFDIIGGGMKATDCSTED